MKTAAIVIDSWKLPIFQKQLDTEGYEYTVLKGPGCCCMTLKVETKILADLYPIVERMNADAARSKMN